MACIQKIQIEDTIYEAKTDFRTAIRCGEIAEDATIGNTERTLGLLCTMFGDKGIDNPPHYEKLLKWALNYLSCGEEIQKTNKDPDMDFIEDMDYIEASFMSDYQIDLTEEDMDWHKFIKLINGLSNSELGNCCVLNRIRNLRTMDLSTIKDPKQRQKIAEAKERVALKKYKKENHLTAEQEASMEKLNEILGL
jgi:hypothetical protein